MTKVKILLVALALGLALAGMSQAQAQTPGNTSVSPQSGPLGTSVTVTITGLTENEVGIAVKYNATTSVGGTTANGTTWTATFTIPTSGLPGSRTFSVIRTPGTATANSAIFTVLAPSISLSSPSGAPGASVTVTGTNFAVSETGITVTFGTTQVGTASAGSLGGWSLTFNVPDGAALGSQSVKATGPTSGALTQPYTVKAGFSVNLTSGPPGSSVTVKGAGFAPSESGVKVTYDGVAVVSTVVVNALGNWTANFTLPDAAGGVHVIGASGASTSASTVDTVNFTVVPALSLSKTSGPPGTAVTVTGAGFGASESNISMTFDGSNVTSGIRADAKGKWTGNFVVPTATAGGHVVSVRGSSSVDDVTFTVGAGINLSRASGAPGSAITVNGAGFSPGETGIGVTFDGQQVLSGIAANSQGTWSATLTVPGSSGGVHTLRATGPSSVGGASTDASFTTSAGITLNRNAGSPGTSVTVTGTGFGANERGISVTYDGVPVASNINSNSQGAWTATINIPASSGGNHVVAAAGSTPQSAATEVNFTVGAGLSLSRSSGPPGTAVTVGGSGFSPNERNITLTYDGVSVSPGLTANAQGTWTVNFVIPPSPVGSHTLAASSASLQGLLAPDAVFAVAPGLAVSRTSGPPGSSVTVNASGFGANERGITLTFDGAPVTSGVSANAQGTWSAVFTVPSSTAGAHTLSASGSSTQGFATTDVTFLVAAALELSRLNASPGTPITITGSGFSANETGISVTYDGTPVASAISASGQGTWSSSFAVPASTAGSHEVRASGSATQAASAPTISLGVVPVISVSPNNGNVGMKADVTGAGYGPNSALSVSLGAGETQGGAISTDGAGSFGFSVVVPRLRAGAQTIRISDGLRNDAQATFTVEGTPPRSPNPISPKSNARIGLTGGATPTITWSNTQDPSGVTYVLQMDVAPDFPQPFLEKFDLTSPSYTLGDGEALPRGRYYWRVRAVDGAYNESAWSNPLVVRSGLIPAWMLVFLVLAGLAAAGGAGWYAYLYYFRRKTEVIRVGEVTVPAPVPGYFRELGAPEGAGRPQQRALGLPSRLALPGGAQRRPKVLSPQEQGRLRILVDFARALPLIQVGYDVGWLEELLRGNGGASPGDDAKEQLLQGRLTPRYDPSWQSHPLYLELRSILDGHPLLQGLDSFMDSVNRCAGDSCAFLQEIFRDTQVDVPVEAVRQGHWQYVFSVYADSLGWFRGKFLREPSERDYTFKEGPEPAAGGPGMIWLQGAEGSPFAGDLVPGVDRAEAQEMLDRHVRLRRTYRASERAKGMVETLAQLEVQRDRLLGGLDQLSQMGAGR